MANSNITRKELADKIGVSTRTIVRKERLWGLHLCISNASTLPVLYFREKASAALLKAGVIVDKL